MLATGVSFASQISIRNIYMQSATKFLSFNDTHSLNTIWYSFMAGFRIRWLLVFMLFSWCFFSSDFFLLSLRWLDSSRFQIKWLRLIFSTWLWIVIQSIVLVSVSYFVFCLYCWNIRVHVTLLSERLSTTVNVFNLILIEFRWNLLVCKVIVMF